MMNINNIKNTRKQIKSEEYAHEMKLAKKEKNSAYIEAFGIGSLTFSSIYLTMSNIINYWKSPKNSTILKISGTIGSVICLIASQIAIYYANNSNMDRFFNATRKYNIAKEKFDNVDNEVEQEFSKYATFIDDEITDHVDAI